MNSAYSENNLILSNLTKEIIRLLEVLQKLKTAFKFKKLIRKKSLLE